MASMRKVCQNCKTDFTIEPEDASFYVKIDVSPPTLCPDCRYRRRLMDRNEWNLYRRKCDATGESIVSIYRPEAPFPGYHKEYWHGNGWDPMQYGRDCDFDRTFFEPYAELRRLVPHMSRVLH